MRVRNGTPSGVESGMDTNEHSIAIMARASAKVGSDRRVHASRSIDQRGMNVSFGVQAPLQLEGTFRAEYSAESL